MELDSKIYEYLENAENLTREELSDIQLSDKTNKNGEKLLIVKSMDLENEIINSGNYKSNIYYYAFNSNGDYVGYVRAFVCNHKSADRVELEYYTCDRFQRQGNMTVLASEVIKEIFEDGILDGLKIKNIYPLTHIENIQLAINPTNYPSLGLANKLGFTNCNLKKEDYFRKKEETPSM